MYLAACPQPLHDIAVLMLETSLRMGEALNLEWMDVVLKPIRGSRFGFSPRAGRKEQECQRVVPLTDRASTMLPGRFSAQGSPLVFPNREGDRYLSTSVNHLHRNAVAPKVEGKRRPLFAGDFVLHSLRHTMLTRLGESGVDAFIIMDRRAQ